MGISWKRVRYAMAGVFFALLFGAANLACERGLAGQNEDFPAPADVDRFVGALPATDLHNDRSFYLTARRIPWTDCSRASLCLDSYHRSQFFFALFRPPRPLRGGAPWGIPAQRAAELNRLSHFQYLELAIRELRAQTRLPVTDDPDLIGSNQALAYLGLEGAFLLNEGADDIPPDEAALDGMLKRLKAAGLSYVGLTWSNANVYAGVAGPGSAGLSARGRTLVRLLIRNGLLIDLSHASDQTVQDVFTLTKGQYPLFFSHSSVRSLCDHPRNLSDPLLDLVRDSGGLVGVNFHSVYVSCSAAADREDVFRHLDYLKRRIGADHAAFGSDFDGLIKLPQGLTHPADLALLARRMIDAGYSRSDIENIYFRNVQRVLRRVRSAREADFFPLNAY